MGWTLFIFAIVSTRLRTARCYQSWTQTNRYSPGTTECHRSKSKCHLRITAPSIFSQTSSLPAHRVTPAHLSLDVETLALADKAVNYWNMLNFQVAWGLLQNASHSDREIKRTTWSPDSYLPTFVVSVKVGIFVLNWTGLRVVFFLNNPTFVMNKNGHKRNMKE